ADRNRSHWSTSKTPSYTKSVSWQHHLKSPAISLFINCPLMVVRIIHYRVAIVTKNAMIFVFNNY
ncbi:hypothetical protein, partial [Yersinia sp. 2105 StPb PI]|uniref:hypothetical protein n=1 Tax=Yersinia sp. 2105 StPb PI TaxID=2507058 RepID=UPI0019D4130B